VKKLINNPLAAADELFDGLLGYYDGVCSKVGRRSIVKNEIPSGKVSLLVGGGAGHEPIYHGMVGANMADAAACGDIFAAPAPNIVLEATAAADRGNGVLFLYGNYAGDILNFDMAAEQAAEQGIEVRTVLIHDDVASSPPDRKHDRRGIAGLVPIVKLVGAASQTAASLDDLASLAEHASLQTRSVGVSLSPGSIPATGKPTFLLEEGKVGLGMGIHGEQGVSEFELKPADEMAELMLQLIIDDFTKDAEVTDLTAGDEIVLVVNSLGSTTMMELLILLRRAREFFAERGIEIFDTAVGPFVTCQEMAGASFSVTRVDKMLKQLWSMPCQSLCFSKMEGPSVSGDFIHETHTVHKASVANPKGLTKSNESLSVSNEGFNLEETKAMLLSVADAIIAAEPTLTDADRALGDGDHGLGMQRGFTALKEQLNSPNIENLAELFGQAGDALITTMGGASGVIFGSLFMAGRSTMKDARYFGSHELCHLLEGSLQTVMQRGGAKPGDKTMIDALAPAAKSAREHINNSLVVSLIAAAQAAEEGKEHSKSLLATTGRAKNLGKKCLGLPDAGAISVAIILAAMRDF